MILWIMVQIARYIRVVYGACALNFLQTDNIGFRLFDCAQNQISSVWPGQHVCMYQTMRPAHMLVNHTLRQNVVLEYTDA